MLDRWPEVRLALLEDVILAECIDSPNIQNSFICLIVKTPLEAFYRAFMDNKR